MMDDLEDLPICHEAVRDGADIWGDFFLPIVS